LNLAHAPFALDDTRLREDGLTCLACPNRSGFNPTLFADVQERDTCLHPLCYQGKCQTFVQLRQTEVAAKRKTPAVLISAFYDRQEEGSGVLGRDEYQLLARKVDRCAFAEPAVVVNGRDTGQEQWICRDDACPDHRGRFAASPTQSNYAPTPVQRQHRRQELFEVKVAEAVRQQVMRQALNSFAWPLARADWNEIAKEFFRRIPSEHQRTIGLVLGWQQEEDSRFLYDEAALEENLATYTNDELARFLRLCSFAHYGANKEMRHAIDQSAVVALSQTCQVNHTLIDATVRTEFSPKKYKAVHQVYLTAVQDEKPMPKPVVFDCTLQEEPALAQAESDAHKRQKPREAVRKKVA
jgi:hypothetical protein